MGGGLAGLTTALDLARRGYEVVLWEKQDFPHHKVCGEFLSTEVAPYLAQLSARPAAVVSLQKLFLTAPSGQGLSAPLDLPAWGISRYRLDHFLAQKARAAGAFLRTGEAVQKVTSQAQGYQVHTRAGVFYCRLLLGALGKRSALERTLRPAQQAPPRKTPFLAVKRHYQAYIPPDTVQLHNFNGGYAGISAVEEGRVNFCYLLHQRQLQRYGSIAAVEEHLLPRNPHLARFLQQARPLMERPLTISNISFAPRRPMQQGLPFLGDTAGLIHPFCGNGMAMAIRSAGLAAELLDQHWQANQLDRFPSAYQQHWQRLFVRRLRFGRRVSPLLGQPFLGQAALQLLRAYPSLMRAGLARAHGPVFNPSPHGL